MAVTKICDRAEDVKLGGSTGKVRRTHLSYNRPSVSLGVSQGHSEEIYNARPSVDGWSDGEVIHIEGGRVTGRGGKHKRSKSNGSPVRAGTDTTRGVRRRTPEHSRTGTRGRGGNILIRTEPE